MSDGELRSYELDGTPLAVLVDAAITWEQELGELGTATLTVPATSRTVDAQIRPGLLVVHTTARGYQTVWYIVSKPRRAFVQSGSPVGADRVRTMVGAVGMLDRASIDPDGADMSEFAPDYRPVGPARVGFDDSDWVAAVSAGPKFAPIFDRDPGHPEGWEVGDDAEYIHPVSDGTDGTDVNAGRGLLRTEFELSDVTEVTVQYTGDDEILELWFAGRPLETVNGLYQWKRTWTQTLVLSAGTHAIYAVVNNLARTNASDNVSHLLLGVVDSFRGAVVKTDTTWAAWPTFPTVIVPGENPGIIMELFGSEAKDRGSLPATLEFNWTASEDSAAAAWAHETAWHWKVRIDKVLTVFRDLQWLCSIDHATVTMGPTGPVLNLVQELGTDRTVGDAPVTLVPGVTDADYEEEPPGVNDPWYRTASGWSHHPDVDAQTQYGLIEGGDTIGVASMPESVAGAAGETITGNVSKRPRVGLTVHDTDRTRFGRDWDLGDTVIVPTPAGDAPGRVLSVGTTDGSDEAWTVVAEVEW